MSHVTPMAMHAADPPDNLSLRSGHQPFEPAGVYAVVQSGLRWAWGHRCYGLVRIEDLYEDAPCNMPCKVL
jgi:hypothetical protein